MDRVVISTGNRHGMFRPLGFLVILIIGVIQLAPGLYAEICGYPAGDTLAVSRAGQTVATFRVALAQSRDQYRKGLMGCSHLARGTGLFFVYPDADRRVFWMKDTPLELAIIFISPGRYLMAIERGRPDSTRRIRSPDNIQFVLEINYDEAGRLHVGDRIILPSFSEDTAPSPLGAAPQGRGEVPCVGRCPIFMCNRKPLDPAAGRSIQNANPIPGAIPCVEAPDQRGERICPFTSARWSWPTTRLFETCGNPAKVSA